MGDCALLGTGLWTVVLRKLDQIFVLYRLHWRSACQPRGSQVGIPPIRCLHSELKLSLMFCLIL